MVLLLWNFVRTQSRNIHMETSFPIFSFTLSTSNIEWAARLDAYALFSSETRFFEMHVILGNSASSVSFCPDSGREVAEEGDAESSNAQANEEWYRGSA